MKFLKRFTVLTSSMLALAFFFTSNISAQDAGLTDPQIASIAVTANQIDIDYGNIALKRSKTESIKNFAQTMIDDHQGVIKMAVDLATKLGVTPEDNATTQSLLDGAKTMKKTLNSKKGAEFDKAYINNEVEYHKAVISTIETVLIPACENEELKALFIKVMPALKAHLKHAEMVQKEING